jgi:hypothetical protein
MGSKILLLLRQTSIDSLDIDDQSSPRRKNHAAPADLASPKILATYPFGDESGGAEMTYLP